MADIKTHLRELSVATTAGLLLSNISFERSDLYDSRTFWPLAKTVISGDLSPAANILDVPAYTGELKSIVDNGYRLGRAIVDHPHFAFHGGENVSWLGYQTQKGDPIDVKIGPYGFSLKEDSFILENMGLYQLLNDLTGSRYPRGLHVFAHFAPAEYDQWFAYTWRCFVAYLERYGGWELDTGRYVSRARLIQDQVILDYDGEQSVVPAGITTNAQYMRSTSAHVREKVFAKWISEQFKNDPAYLTLKKTCALTAGEQVAAFITSHYDPTSAARFFQIRPQAYYYAKTTAYETTILRVPGMADFAHAIRLVDCCCDVPASQLNIISTFENTATGRTLEFRNECRFSHGQFNGTPEAKLYVRRNTSLTDLYDPI